MRSPLLSPISYSDAEWLQAQLESLPYVKHYRITKHQPDKDNAKAHCHLKIWIDGEVDSEALTKTLSQLDVSNGKPLTTYIINPKTNKPNYCSNIDEGVLYDEHNAEYLAVKGLEREHVNYPQSEVLHDNDEQFHADLVAGAYDYLANMCKGPSKVSAEMVQLLGNGLSPVQVVSLGYNPTQVLALSRLIQMEFKQTKEAQLREQLGREYNEKFLEQEETISKLQSELYDTKQALLESENPFKHIKQTTIDDWKGVI